jgi:hypothetical protein
MKYIIVFLFMLIITMRAMSLGKVYPTCVPVKTSSSHCVVKTISELPEFAHLISDVDSSRRYLELREGINEAKAKHFTFKTICGTTYVSVFGIK